MADGGLLESIAPFSGFWDTRNTAGLEGIALTIRSYSRQSGFFYPCASRQRVAHGVTNIEKLLDQSCEQLLPASGLSRAATLHPRQSP